MSAVVRIVVTRCSLVDGLHRLREKHRLWLLDRSRRVLCEMMTWKHDDPADAFGCYGPRRYHVL